MTSQEEAERTIRELTGEYKLDENVYESGRKFLRELLLYIDAKAFTKSILKKNLHTYLSRYTLDQSTGEDELSSVFKSTAKTYLHSGSFSIDLRLSSSDGKIKPSWVSPSAPIPDVLTRMVIYFHDFGTEEHLERLKNVILAQFESFQAESLLFLRDLRCITVEFYGKGVELCQSKRFRKRWMKVNRELLKTTIDKHDEKEEICQMFHVTERGALGRRNVTLAFPLTEAGKPLTKTREIRHMVQRNLLMKAYNQSVLRCMNEITLLPDHLKDEQEQPLLEPFENSMFLSADYPQRVVQILQDHGAKTMQDETFLEHLEAYMRLQKPKMHQKYTTEEWHTRMARFLLQFSKTSTFNASRVKSMAIVPLNDGTWASVLFGPIYFARTGDVCIPESVDLRIAAPAATRDPDRYALFKYLGVTEPSIEIAGTSVLKSLTASDDMPLRLVNDYMKYLYLTHEISGWTAEQYQEVRVLTTDLKLESPLSKTIHLPGKDYPFSPENLLGHAESGYSLTCSFLHPETLTYVQTQSNSLDINWKKWLCEYIGIREEISLESAGTGKLSSDFLHVVSQSPGKLLDLLEHLLSKGVLELLNESTLVSEIRQLPAGILCDVEFTPKLQDTWLPLKPLTGLVEAFMDQTEQFPFLKSIQNDTGGIDTKWDFLSEHLLVGKEANLDFYLEILRAIRRSGPDKNSALQFMKVLLLYPSIYATFTASGEKTVDKKTLRNFSDESGVAYFNEEKLEWTSASSCLWDAPTDMVTMRSLKSRYDLRDSVADLKDELVVISDTLQSLFSKTLGIQNAKLEHLVAELNQLRIRNDVDPTQIFRVYDFLNTKIPSSQEMRNVFEKSPLIFIPNGQYMGWHTSTEVLWSSNTDLCGMGILDDTYEPLRDLFVDKLGIQSLSLRVLYDQLIKSPRCSPQQMKKAIFIVNDFLGSDPTSLDWQPIRNAEIFPVRDPNGKVCLKSAETDFAIGDNDNLRMSFEKKISLLDFTLLECHQLKPFFKWLKIEDRYLSRCVQEDLISISAGSLFRPPEPLMPYQKRNLKYKARYITR
ncbi:hypothetical protein FPRO05_02865 [Fusarium proliferatum]|uniref:Uncharacterized protein n=1 Tax=Gibberella intermedia TaxID=948311 RepID=A0A365MZV4_GIBIN|nr:hypothetical protein FPRO05_02865 [Fusarium proliferatum]